MKTFYYFKDYINFGTLLLTVCLTLLNSLIELGFVYLIVQTITLNTIDLVFAEINLSTTSSKITIILTLVSIKFVVGLLTTFHVNILVSSIWHKLVTKLFTIIITSPYHEFYSTPTGVYTRKLIVDAQRMCYEFLLPAILIISEVWVAVLLLAYASNLIDPVFASRLFYVLMATGILVILVLKYIKRLGIQRTVAEGELSDILDATFKGYIFARVNKYQTEIIRQMTDLSSKSIRAIRNHSITSQTPRYLFEIIMIFLLLLMLQNFHSQNKFTGENDFAKIITVFLIFIRITPSLNRILTYTGQIVFNYHLANNYFQNSMISEQQIDDSSPEVMQSISNYLDKKSIIVNNISLKFGANEIFSDKSFSFNRGMTYALKGPNGSGKSSFLKVLAGLIEPTTGSISLTQNTESQLLNVYYLEQNSFLFRGTVESNILLDIKQTSELRDRVRRLIEYFFPDSDVEEYLSRNVAHAGANFSGGEKQKISLIRAIIQEPDIILLDESLSAIDVPMREKVYSNLRSLFSSAITIIVISHNDDDFVYVDKVIDF